MKQVELLLQENVDNLGIVGDVVKVRPGYARNYLLPRGLATTPTPGAIEALKERRRQVEAELRQQREAQQAMIERLEGHEVTLERAANEQGVLFGSVSQRDIADALRADGFGVEDRFIRVGDPLKRLDSYMIPVVIDRDLKCEIKLWIVSDKPAEELAAEGEAGEAAEAGAEAAEGETPEGEPETTA